MHASPSTPQPNRGQPPSARLPRLQTANDVSHAGARTYWEGERAHIGWITVPLMGRWRISWIRSVAEMGILGEVALVTDRPTLIGKSVVSMPNG